MEFKGTKGKWIPETNYGVSLENGEYVFQTGCGCCTSGDLDKYDALLISKAPELLEMLQYFINNNMMSVTANEMAEQLIKEATEL